MRSVSNGFVLQPPEGEARAALFDSVCDARGDIVRVDDEVLLDVPQTVEGENSIDSANRIEIGTELLKQLTGAGL
jgi:hypothetical protein